MKRPVFNEVLYSWKHNVTLCNLESNDYVWWKKRMEKRACPGYFKI